MRQTRICGSAPGLAEQGSGWALLRGAEARSGRSPGKLRPVSSSARANAPLRSAQPDPCSRQDLHDERSAANSALHGRLPTPPTARSPGPPAPPAAPGPQHATAATITSASGTDTNVVRSAAGTPKSWRSIAARRRMPPPDPARCPPRRSGARGPGPDAPPHPVQRPAAIRNPDLPRPLRHDVRHHPVHPDQRRAVAPRSSSDAFRAEVA